MAHFHYVMAGTIFVFFGGIYYWWPKISGAWRRRSANQRILLFVGLA